MPFLSHIDFAAVREAIADRQPEPDETLGRALALLDNAIEAVASPGLAELARDIHGCDEVEIDDEGAGTSPSDDGTWVQAWVWVAHEQLVEAGLAEPDEDEEIDQ